MSLTRYKFVVREEKLARCHRFSRSFKCRYRSASRNRITSALNSSPRRERKSRAYNRLNASHALFDARRRSSAVAPRYKTIGFVFATGTAKQEWRAFRVLPFPRSKFDVGQINTLRPATFEVVPVDTGDPWTSTRLFRRESAPFRSFPYVHRRRFPFYQSVTSGRSFPSPCPENQDRILQPRFTRARRSSKELLSSFIHSRSFVHSLLSAASSRPHLSSQSRLTCKDGQESTENLTQRRDCW